MHLNNLPRVDYGLKKSFISQNYHQHQQSTNRSSLVKRSSFASTSEYSSTMEHPRTPKAGSTMPYIMDNHSIANHYYHQSNYVNHNQYPVQQMYAPQQQQVTGFHPSANRVEISTSRVEPVANKIEAFTLDDKKSRETQLEQKIRDMTLKLDRTISQVQKHETILKQHESSQLNTQTIAKIIQQTIQQQQRQKQTQNNKHINIIKGQIEGIRAQIINFVDRIEIDQRLAKIAINFDKTVEVVNRDLMEHLNSMTEMHARNRKKELDKVKAELEYQIGQIQKGIQQKLRRQKDDSQKLTQSSSFQTLPSRKIFLGDPLLVKYASKVSITLNQQTKQIEDQQIVYKIDHDGYLLDGEGRYLVNSRYEQIRLSEEQIGVIRDRGFLK